MNNGSHTNTYVEVIRIFTTFVSDNFGYILLFTFLIIARHSIPELIGRLINLRWKKGDSEFGIEAVSPQPINEERRLEQTEELPNEPDDLQENTDQKGSVDEHSWDRDMLIAFREGRIDDAKDIFKNYEANENDICKLESQKAEYLYYLFTKGEDNNAINELRGLVSSSRNEESKYDVLKWLSLCLRAGSQFDADIELWQTYVNSFDDEHLKSSSTVDLVQSLKRAGKAFEGKKLLLSCLKNASSPIEKSNIYNALSDIEGELGEKTLSVYCKDKFLELSPNDRNELFNTAYQASAEGIDELSISNYDTLLNIDSNNSMVLNNLGVRAQEEDLRIKAVENYRMSMDKSNTLAMANQGYLLLNAGFVEEAKALAEKALEINDPHENVHSLLSRISEDQRLQDEKWNQLIISCKEHQKVIRNFTFAYYEGDIINCHGIWKTSSRADINFKVVNNHLTAKWQEGNLGLRALSNGEYNEVELIGDIVRSAFRGQYKMTGINNNRPVGLLGISSNKDIECIGVFFDQGMKLSITATKSSEKFNLEFFRSNTQ